MLKSLSSEKKQENNLTPPALPPQIHIFLWFLSVPLLPFKSKVLQRMVYCCYLSFSTSNSLLKWLQYGFYPAVTIKIFSYQHGLETDQLTIRTNHKVLAESQRPSAVWDVDFATGPWGGPRGARERASGLEWRLFTNQYLILPIF